MRISGGQYRNKKITAPQTPKTRPMTDEMREAVFNILGPIKGFNVLDTYAGSGVIGLEALSRGAAKVDAVEMSNLSSKTLMANVGHLGVNKQYNLYRQSLEDWLRRYKGKLGGYDLIFIDPPFAEVSERVIAELAGFLQPQGLLVVRTPTNIGELAVAGLESVKTRRSGGSLITFYKYSGQANSQRYA